MSYHNATDYLIAKLDEEAAGITAHIVRGSLNESEYRRLCRQLQGLELAKNYIKDLAKRLEAADE